MAAPFSGSARGHLGLVLCKMLKFEGPSNPVGDQLSLNIWGRAGGALDQTCLVREDWQIWISAPFPGSLF